jgi:DNA-binding response OmpR family regulator
MRGRVLIVDPDGDRLVGALGAEGLAVERGAEGETVLDLIRARHYDLVIGDLEMPGLGGLEGCRQLRYESDVALLILTARDSEADRVLGLEAGADDYVGKPYSLAEVISRVRALLRRRQLDVGPLQSLLRVGELEIDLVRHRVLLGGGLVTVTPTEFRLLALLARAPGRAFSAQEILRHLWETDYVGEGSACKAHVCNLRHKIERDSAHPERLVTVPGAGYALVG